MNRRAAAAALMVLAILPLTACSNAFTTTDELGKTRSTNRSTLVVDARAGSIAIEVGDGPINVTEQHRATPRSKPATAHQVDGHTLRLTESGCRDDGGHCDVSYRIRMPSAHVGADQCQGRHGASRRFGGAFTPGEPQPASVEGHALSSP